MFYQPIQTVCFFNRSKLYASIDLTKVLDIVPAFMEQFRNWYIGRACDRHREGGLPSPSDRSHRQVERYLARVGHIDRSIDRHAARIDPNHFDEGCSCTANRGLPQVTWLDKTDAEGV